MIDDLIAAWFFVLWAISAVCLWVLKASVSAVVWLLKAPLRFRDGWNREKRRQEQRAS